MNETVAAKAMDAAEKLTVRSALNPILWMCAIVSLPSLLVAAALSDIPLWLSILLALLICGPVGAAIFGFIYLLVKDPDKLQSEEYQIKKQSLMYMQQKGQPVPIPIASPQAFVTPDLIAPELGKGEES